MDPDVTVVFPAFDEAQRIGPTLRAFDAFLASTPHTYELLVVDDGSTDGTVALVRSLAAELPALRCMESDRNRGKGHAVRLGMLAARGRLRVMSDADGSTPPDQLPRLLQPLLDGEAQVAIGSRYVPGAEVAVRQPWFRRAWSRFANLVIRAVLLPGIADTHCGFKALTAAAAEAVFSRVEVDGWSFDLEVLALARHLGFTVREVGVRWEDDARSRVRPHHVLRSVLELLAIRQRVRRAEATSARAG